MLKAIITNVEWDSVYNDFENADIYYSYGYSRPFAVHGDGEPILFYYEANGVKAINAVTKRKIILNGKDTGLFDLATPYGYGGWLFKGEFDEKNMSILNEEYCDFCKENGIVSEFVRFHPLLKNAHIVDGIYEVIDLGNTIAIELTDEENIWNEQLSGRNRTSIRKAQRSGIEIGVACNKDIISAFKNIYDATMHRDEAEEYYFFGDEFYQSMVDEMKENFTLYYASLNGEIIGASIIMWGKNYVHYHLSGAKREYMNLAPMNLLLYQVALDFLKQGKKFFHLGGGVGSDSNSGLYRFKESFNKNGANRFSIGKKIFDQDAYNRLVNMRKAEQNFNEESKFFPLYRS